MTKKQRVGYILDELNRLYPSADCSLDHSNAFELLVATQLAAQCTDARVNIVTKTLFKKYKEPEDFVKTNIEEIENDIRSTGFYHNKAKNLQNCCLKLITKYNGMVPDSMEELLKLDGVGRKTANVILGDIFNIPGIVVDTHTKRLSNRLGLTKFQDPKKIEYDLMKIIPKKYWISFGHQLVYHGRKVCIARKPQCEKCSLAPYCSFVK